VLFEPWRLDFFIEHSDDLVLSHTGTTDSYHQPPLCAKCLAYPAALLTFITKLIFLFVFNILPATLILQYQSGKDGIHVQI
jgi:hypothetical protein